MTDHATSWDVAFRERTDLASFGSAGLALFAMAVKFGYDDLETIGADAVVDGPDDKSCDVVYIDLDQKIALIAQAYYAETPKTEASTSKAASLRQGISYLVEVEPENIPPRLQSSAAALRAALQQGEIETIYVWFVHNCPGSENVKRELEAVGRSAHAIIRTQFADTSVNVLSEEISSDVLGKLYTDTNTPILVNEAIQFTAPGGFATSQGDWSCFVTSIPVQLLRELYKRFGTDLFSANVENR